MNTMPLVTIAAINYNNSKYVLDTLNSIKNQKYFNIELIIVDDCSTDNSLSIIEEWLKSYDGSYKLIIHKQNQGFHSGLNDALDSAQGKYFSLIATDDIMLPEKIYIQVNLIESLPDDVAMIYGDCMIIGESGEELCSSIFERDLGKSFVPPSGNIFKNIINDFYFYTQSALIKLSLLNKIKFRFDSKIISEDWDLELALSSRYKIYGCSEVFTKYRRTSTSLTSTNWNQINMHKVFKSHFLMFEKYVNNPFNTQEEKYLILEKMRQYLYILHNSISYKERVSLWYKIIYHSRNYIDLVRFVKRVLKF